MRSSAVCWRPTTDTRAMRGPWPASSPGSGPPAFRSCCPAAPRPPRRRDRSADSGVALGDDGGDGARVRVSEREEPAPDAGPARDRRGAPVHDEPGRVAGRAHDLEVAPPDPARPSRPERLHRRLLGREARRVAREAPAPARLAVRLLLVGEDARANPGPGRGLERAPDAVDVADVEADTYDHARLVST